MNSVKVYIILLLLLSFKTYAQTNLPKDTFVVVKEYEPILNDVYKIKENPIIQDSSKLIPNLKYNFVDKQYPVVYQIDTIKHAKIKGEPLVKLYRGYLKLGYGTNSTPLIQAYYNAKRSRGFNYGINVNHYSTKGISSNDYSQKSDNNVGVFVKNITRKHSIYSNLYYNRHINHYYGFPDPEKVIISNSDELIQHVNNINASLKINRINTDTSKVKYNSSLFFNHANDIYDVTENRFVFSSKATKKFGHELFSLKGLVDYNKLSNQFDSTGSALIGLFPTITTNSNTWQLKIGAKVFINNQNTTTFHLYPNAELKYNVVDDIIVPYIGMDGSIIRTSFYHTYKENQFINSSTLQLINQNKKYELYGGVKGNLSSFVSFNTGLKMYKLENMPFYVKDVSEIFQNKFTFVYDTVDVLNLYGEISYKKLEKIKFLLSGNYFSYSPTMNIEAWHKPNYKITLTSIYDLRNKIVLRLNIFSLGKQYAPLVNDNGVLQAEELKGIVDANLSLEYRYTKKLSAFINFNNIASANYQKWQDYQIQRFNILGGLTYSF